MFWTFKLSFNLDILTFFGHFVQKLGSILINFLVTLARVGTKKTQVVWEADIFYLVNGLAAKNVFV